MKVSRHAVRHLDRLVVGLALYGVAVGLIVTARLGVDPWDVLALGVARHVGLPFGVLTNIIGALVLLLWIPLRQRPGLGTVLNVLLVGSAAQVVLWLMPPIAALWPRIGLFALGILLLATATGLYVGAGRGAGPRDGLMLGVHSRFGLPIWVARTGVEGSVLLIGWVLGGNVGIGTVVFALAIGPLCGITIPLLRSRPRPALLPATAHPASHAPASPPIASPSTRTTPHGLGQHGLDQHRIGSVLS